MYKRQLLNSYGDRDVRVRAKAYAAAGSDARMSGCELPVIINSGSGNQGITVSVPVIEYAREMGASKERLYRALLISNLTAIRLKTLIGCLSAYCGAISAGCASGAGIAYLCGGDLYLINHTPVSYTHLDVYKRQEQNRRAGRFPPHCRRDERSCRGLYRSGLVGHLLRRAGRRKALLYG